MREYVMDDILVGMGYFLSEGNLSFRHDRESWHRFFYERKFNYPILKDIPFRMRMFPESQEIDQAYSNLIASGLLYWKGIEIHPPHEFSSECKPCFEKWVKKLFSETELEEIQGLSKEFQQEFSLEDAVASQSAN
jgi:hypothetical protein